MSDDELKLWNDERLRLFEGARIPPHALAAILHDTRNMDFARAMRALVIYRAAKPYRGFYAVDWARHYNMTAPADAGGTGRAASRAPAPREEDHIERERVAADKAREIERYNALPASTREEARAALAHLGWEINDHSRAWRILVLRWSAGEDVSGCLHPSRLCSALPERRERAQASRDQIVSELRVMLESVRAQLIQYGEAA